MGSMTEVPYLPRRAYRDPDDRIVGGVAAGLAQHLGVGVTQTRVVFLLLVLLSGLGFVLYIAFWVLLPTGRAVTAPLAPGVESATRSGFRTEQPPQRRRDVGLAVPFVIFGVGLLILIQNVGFGISPGVFWPLLVAAAGLCLLWWRNEGARNEWLASARGWKFWLRVAIGVLLLVAAVGLGLVQAGAVNALGAALGALALGVIGVGLVIGPWLFRANRAYQEERAERVRTQERADMAAHLHDSVLQTLALIQRQSGDPAAVSRLARTQERELRTWLFDTPATESDTVKSMLQRAVAEVEDTHGFPVELVVVGDAESSDEIRALVAAAREAMVNAAKHSGAGHADVYAEVSAEEVDVFVRDRGRGFDPEHIAADRHGVRQSIVDRLERHGGHAEVRSEPENGTEVRLSLPLDSEGENAR